MEGKVFMNREMVKKMRIEIENAVNTLGHQHGLKIHVGNIKFSDTGFKAQVICDEVTDGGLPAKYKRDWDLAVMYGDVEAEWYGVVSKDGKNSYKVVGYDFGKRKNNIILEQVDNKKIYSASKSYFLGKAFLGSMRTNFAQAGRKEE